MKRGWALFCAWRKRHRHANGRSLTGWRSSTTYAVGDIISFNGELIRITGCNSTKGEKHVKRE